MKKAWAIVPAALPAVALFSTLSFAAGFSLPDQDAAAMGMAGAFAGQADNASAVWYNPAGITQLEGAPRVSAGVVGIYPVMRHENTDGTTDISQRKLFLPAQFFGTARLDDGLFFGLGINTPFGLSTKWPDTSAASGVATFSRVKTIEINPNIAYRVSNRLSFAFGIDYIILQATMENLTAPGVFRLDGEGSGWGANAGVLYKAGDQMHIGLSYRSRIKVRVNDGSAEVAALSLSNPVRTDITLPDLAQVGLSYNATEKLTLNGDLGYTWWSTYDRLVIRSNTLLTLTSGTSDTMTDEKDWKNTWTVRIGGQYRLSDAWKIRAGYVYDQNPVPSDRFDTRLPDSDRQGFTVGTGYSGGNFTIDVSYMYLLFKDRTITDSLADGATHVLNGTYKSVAHLAAVTVGYKF